MDEVGPSDEGRCCEPTPEPTWRVTRRALLAGTGAAVAGTAGCLSLAPPDGTDGTGTDATVSLLAAGSLNYALQHGLQSATDATVQIEAHGSAQVARMVAEGQKEPDVVSVADVALFDGPLHPPWFAEFATNSVVLAYDPDSEGGKRLEAAGSEAWFRPLLSGEVALGRTDPDLDPLGYRTLLVLDLASEYYGTDVDLRDRIPAPGQIYPETQLVSQFETGSIDAAFTYRNMAVERDYAYVALPPAVDLSDPAHADAYARTSYELPSGKVVRGAPISYGSTARTESDPAFDVFETHVGGEYLTEFGFTVPDAYPEFTGDVPARLAG